jgi:hypothetical protein
MIIGGNDSVSDYNIIYTTTDGGTHWVVAPMNKVLSFGQAYGRAYGNGKFRFFQGFYGTIFTTLDNFQTIDSTKPIFDSLLVVNGHQKELVECNFGSGDSIIAYGEDLIYDTVTHVNYYGDGYPLIWRTTNAGLSWKEVFDDDSDLRGVTRMSAIDRDTIIAGVSSDIDNILFSSDHGATWKVDTLLIDTAMDVLGCFGIGLSSNGNLVGAFGPLTVSLIYGQLGAASVSMPATSTPDASIYPNPASSSITIASSEVRSTVYLLDMLGREVLHGVMPAYGPLTLDVSFLPSGLYYVSDGIMRAKFVKE